MGAVLEAFPTLGTLVQAFHNVDLPMSAKWEFVDSLPTDSALIRLLPSVGPPAVLALLTATPLLKQNLFLIITFLGKLLPLLLPLPVAVKFLGNGFHASIGFHE